MSYFTIERGDKVELNLTMYNSFEVTNEFAMGIAIAIDEEIIKLRFYFPIRMNLKCLMQIR